MDKDKLDISLLLVIFTTTIAIWLFINNSIIYLTTTQPTNDNLFTLSFSHFLSFICILLAFIVLSNKCMHIMEVNKETFSEFNELAISCQEYLFTVWGIMLVFSLISLGATNFFLQVNFHYQLISILLFSSVICVLLFRLMVNVSFKFMWTSFTTINKKHIIFFIVTYFLYVPILVLYSSGINFTSEKKFYTSSDIIRFEVKPTGYIFLPYVEKVNYGFKTSDVNKSSDYCYYVDLKKEDLYIPQIIEITYKLQIFGIVKKEYFYMNVTPK